MEVRKAMAATSAKATNGFPRAWSVGDDSVTFMLDPMHFPFAVSPLTNVSLNEAFSAGFTTAAREMDTPIAEFQARSSNWFHFERYIMAEPASEEEAHAMHERAEATAKREVRGLGERWEREHLPRLEALLGRLAEMGREVAGADSHAAIALVDEAQQIHRELWTIHFRIAIPMLLAMQLYDEFYMDIFGAADSDAHALLRGVSSKSVQAGIGLCDLANAARELGLDRVFRDNPPDRLIAILETDEPGRAFLARLREYLDAYGLRQDLFDLAVPTWREYPEIALSSVRTYILTGRDERIEYEATIRSAEAALAHARAQLASYPEAVRGQFEGLYHAGRTASFLQEEHNFYIDQQGLARLRLFFLAIGQRLAGESVIERADDVFMFTVDELRDLLSSGDDSSRAERGRGIASVRQGEMAIARTLTPPPVIGPPPSMPPGDNPMIRGLGRFFGGPPQESEASNELKGNAGSRGIVSGPARVARTLEEATALQPGEVLVAVTTMPAWTPLFAIAAAVVTETGGPLSHCAIVAREYGIPAVVGAHGATRAIVDGQRITVDGGRGVVMLDG